MTNQVERLSVKRWAEQFDMSEEQYSDKLENVRRLLELEADNTFWAVIVNKYQLTSAKQYNKTINRLIDWGSIHGINEETYFSLVRLNDKGVYDGRT